MKVSVTGKVEECERVSFGPLEEVWTKYRLADGTVIRLRLVASDVFRLNKRGPTGESQYVVRSSNIIAVEEPDAVQNVH